ncbi:MAG TPA: hypothetical protein VHH35_04765 [Pyrinomonadaceae bacterium]|nr:hypothetical protein [Pyrinomonadaceae bacterium]
MVGTMVLLLLAHPTAAQWNTNGNNINNTNSGNVGVGTTAPNSKLHVAGGIYSSAVIESANTNGFQLVVSGPGDSRASWTYSGGSTTTRLTSVTNVKTSFGSNGINDRLFLDLAGRVGIGTTTPTSKLHLLSGTDSATTLFHLDTGTHGGTAFAVSGTASNESGYDMSVFRAGQYFSRFGVSTAGNVYLQPGGGTVGIGTGTPNTAYRLDVQGGSINASGGLCIAGDCKSAWSQITGISQWTTSGSTINYASGNVGIATASPTEKLEVTGNIKVTGSINVSGNINAKYQDVAEWVESSQVLAPGTVVVLDTTKSNQVIAATQAYDSRVAGVISLQPGLALGEAGEGRVLVATTGRVKVKVDATNGPIQIGDLLVTSDREGLAMRSMPVEIGGVRIHRPGTLIGKALEPLAKGTGEILVLLSMQ